ncbi:MAG: hypothetical protein ACE5H1_08170, partial [Thermodesulfobacteriota bacterium]
TSEDIEFDIVTDNDEVVIVPTKTVLIPKGKHHGIYTIETNGAGQATVYAVYKDVLLKQNIRVIESATTPTELDLILPSDLVNVMATEEDQTGYVFLINDFDNPVAAKNSKIVALTSDGEVVLTKNSVTIEPSKHYAKFMFKARGDGTITATAPDLEPDEEDVSVTDPDEIELHLAIAPDPIPTESSAEIYFWLERDGKPYLAPHDVKITISIDKSANLSFDSAMEGAIVLTPNTADRRTQESGAREIITRTESQLSFDSEQEFILKKGVYYGKMLAYASFDESSDITISGLAESLNPENDEEIIQETDLLSTSTEKSNSEIATETKVFAYPDPAYDQVEIIVSSRSDDGPVIESDDYEEFTVFTSRELKLGSIGGSILADENYSIVFADVQEVGTAEIFAERNEAESDEIEIDTEEKYVKDSQLAITPLPILFGLEQDLFLVTSAHDIITTNPESNDEGILVSITAKPSFEFESIKESESVITVRGTVANLSEESEEDPKVYVASNAETVIETLDVHNPHRKTIVSNIPQTVFPKEPFPIVNHIADLDKNPLLKADLKISSSADLNIVKDLVYLNETGQQTLIFYSENTVPVESSILVKGAGISKSQLTQNEKPTVVTYNVIVENGEGSGIYQEGTEITISAPPVLEDNLLFKKKFVGWEDLPYTEPTATFEVDDDI